MKKYNYDLTVLTNENDISYYILGMFISDGCVTPTGKNTFSSSVASKDKDWLIPVRDLFDKTISIHPISNENCFKLTLHNKQIGEWLIKNECIPNKSLVVKLPAIPAKYYPDLIRGIFDGDGSLTIYSDKRKEAKDFKAYICGSSICLLESIKTILNNNDIDCIITSIIKKPNTDRKGRIFTQKNPHWRLYFNKTNTLKFLSFIYYDDHKLSLARKLQKFEMMKNIFSKEQLVNNQLDKNCKIIWPNDEDLIELVKNNTYRDVGKMLGVSNVSVVGRMKVHGIYIPKGRGKGQPNEGKKSLSKLILELIQKQ